VAELRRRVTEQSRTLASFAIASGREGMTFAKFEREVRDLVFAVGRTAIVLFLTCAEARVRRQTATRLVRSGRAFERTRAKDRSLTTWFGTVRYWRTYMRELGVKKGRGFFPLDVALGLVSDRFSLGVLAVVVRLATKLSFAEAKSTAEHFLPVVPSTEVIEQATLGFGRFTSEWFEVAPPPEDDGDVLVILFDSKGAPTATARELRRRRRPRKGRSKAPSPRHRGRKRRGRYDPLPRRQKGDKSKNAKMATVVVMYTLRSDGTLLLGPINKWLYASFAPKKHAFAVARREADKRGFAAGSGQIVQIVTDGDNDLERYAGQYFPEATYHTLDVAHVVERLWEAGGCFLREGSKALTQWVEAHKDLLFAGDIKGLLAGLRRAQRSLGRGKKRTSRRNRLGEIIAYLSKRQEMMSYAELMDEDFEVGSGAVEGAVKNVIGKRCDQGGMRWIRERAEAVVQLRCIELNGDWDRFVEHVHDRVHHQGLHHGARIRIQQNEPAPLPEIEEAA
jgi:hypothetical protein